MCSRCHFFGLKLVPEENVPDERCHADGTGGATGKRVKADDTRTEINERAAHGRHGFHGGGNFLEISRACFWSNLRAKLEHMRIRDEAPMHLRYQKECMASSCVTQCWSRIASCIVWRGLSPTFTVLVLLCFLGMFWAFGVLFAPLLLPSAWLCPLSWLLHFPCRFPFFLSRRINFLMCHNVNLTHHQKYPPRFKNT